MHTDCEVTFSMVLCAMSCLQWNQDMVQFFFSISIVYTLDGAISFYVYLPLFSNA